MHQVARVERWLAGKQFVERRAERVDVVRRLRRTAVHLLRAHVAKRAADGAAERDARDGVADARGEAEVGELQLAVGIEHHVGRLEVAVDHLAPVRVIERFAKLLCHWTQLGPRERAARLLCAQHAEIRAAHIFHRDERHLATLMNEIVNANDIRVREPAALQRLLPQFGQRDGIL